MGLLLGLIALVASLWGGASWAIDYKAEQAIAEQLRDEQAAIQDINNIHQLIDIRLTVMEKRLTEVSERIEFLYRQELQRAQTRRANGEP